MNILICSVILVLAFKYDLSGIKQRITGKKAVDFEERGTDARVELYKTLSYVLLGGFWLFLRYVQYIIPCIIGLNILAFIHHLRNPEIIRKASLEVKTFPTLNRMFLVCGGALGVLIVVNTIRMSKKSIIISIGLSVVIYLSYVLFGIKAKAKVSGVLVFIAPVLFFVFGLVLSVNSFYGIRKVQAVETVVEDVRIGMRADAFYIPEEDALDGQRRFNASMLHKKVGDRVRVVEFEGCLGIRWFTVSWIEE